MSFDARAQVITEGRPLSIHKAWPSRQGCKIKVVVNGNGAGALPWVEESVRRCLISSFIMGHAYVGLDLLEGGEHVSMSTVGEHQGDGMDEGKMFTFVHGMRAPKHTLDEIDAGKAIREHSQRGRG